MQWNKVSAHVLAVWRIELLLLAAPAAFAAAFLYVRMSTGQLWFLIGCALLAALFFLAFFLYCPLKFRKLAYCVGEDYFIIRSGVFFHRVKAVPYTSVQYTSLAYSPLTGWFGLRTLKVFLAGTSLRLPGLALSDAQALRGMLSDIPGGARNA